ncbi:hypothetical protein U8607_07815 [Methylobacterium durans]|uniref:hypothetical protein n=1 Tax=Methylobacterium durans TaxID=2202825 RepID=UPI002B000ACD|nr:hypothetical protein [Methylobacterium durans]MEA1831990.1 hypothetical protein [Methylobacterium durans]
MREEIAQSDSFSTEGCTSAPVLSVDTRFRLGHALRTIYEDSVDRQPIPDSQVDLLLRLRHKERDRQRGSI